MKFSFKNIILTCITLLLVYYTIVLIPFYQLFLYLFKLFFPVIIAIVVNFLLEPLIDYFASPLLERKIVVIHLYLTLTLFLFVMFYYICPYIINGCLTLYNDYLMTSTYSPIISEVLSFLEKYKMSDLCLSFMKSLTQSLIYWITNIALGLGISFYLSLDDLHLIEMVVCYLDFSNQAHILKYLKIIKIRTHQFIKSLVLDFVFFFLLCLIPFFFIDSSLFLAFSLFLAVTNLIPYIGPYVGAIPVVIYEYLQVPTLGYITLIIILMIQMVESNLIQPFLFKKCISLHPILLFLSLSLFGDLFGIIGMILSPLLAVYVLIIIDYFKEIMLKDKITYYLMRK